MKPNLCWGITSPLHYCTYYCTVSHHTASPISPPPSWPAERCRGPRPVNPGTPAEPCGGEMWEPGVGERTRLSYSFKCGFSCWSLPSTRTAFNGTLTRVGSLACPRWRLLQRASAPSKGWATRTGVTAPLHSRWPLLRVLRGASSEPLLPFWCLYRLTFT